MKKITDNNGQGMMTMLLTAAVVIIIGGIVFIPLDQIWKEHVMPMGASLGTNATQIDNMNIMWNASLYLILFGIFMILLVHSAGR